MLPRTATLALVVFAFSSCKDAPSAPKKPECNTKIPELGICLNLPAGYKAGPVTKNESENYPFEVNLLNDTAASITIQAGIGTLDEARSGSSFFVDTTKYEVKTTGDLQSPRGWWYYSSSKEGTSGSNVGVFVQGPKYLFSCELAGASDAKECDAVVSICKTITPLPN